MQRRTPQVKAFITLSLTIFCTLFFIHDYVKYKERTTPNYDPLALLPTKKTLKWIVVTTVQNPTEDLKRLASHAHYTLVVVGDQNTPDDWNLADVHYLSPEIQDALGYEISKAIPWKSYTRKNIGYLYAIANGARWIYDTDDDNKPWENGLEQFDFEEINHGLRFTGIQESEDLKDVLFNPYRHFGRADMWPRGFPLDHINDHTHKDGSYRLCRKMRTASVQQGIVNKDPDVDAIYRLLHAQPEEGLNERFNRFAPTVVLAPGSYSPFNSQNTLFSYVAFFGLVLPTTVSFRSCDIWRSYYTQILLHLLGETVSFVPQNAKQVRNSHSYLNDFEQEINVYEQASAILEFAREFKCEEQTLEGCMMTLAHEFAGRGYWEGEDAVLIEAWIKDLKSLNYTFPPLNPNARQEYPLSPDDSTTKNCRRAHLDLHVDLPADEKQPAVERVAKIIENYNDLKDWCASGNGTVEEENFLRMSILELEKRRCFEPNMTKPRDWQFPSPQHAAQQILKNGTLTANYQTVAILTNNYEFEKAMGLQQRMYAESFGAFIFCGIYPKQVGTSDGMKPEDKYFPKFRKPISYVYLSIEEVRGGFWIYYCMAKVAELRLQNVKGYFMFSDDALFNFWHPLDLTRAQSGKRAPGAGPWWINEDYGQSTANRSIDLMKTKYSQDREVLWMLDEYRKMLVERNITFNGRIVRDPFEHFNQMDGWIISDWLFIPDQYMKFTRIFTEIAFEGGLFLELFFSKLLWLLPHDMHASEDADGYKYLWNYNRFVWCSNYSKELVGLHPLKPSNFIVERKRQQFCNFVLPAFHSELFERK